MVCLVLGSRPFAGRHVDLFVGVRFRKFKSEGFGFPKFRLGFLVSLGLFLFADDNFPT